jgi:4'-phosphopantetheinyl transferase
VRKKRKWKIFSQNCTPKPDKPMPLTKMNAVGRNSTWALWHITENEEELGFEAMETCPEEIISPQKRLEWLGGRALLRELTENSGLNYAGVRKDEYGKPFLKELNHQISLSHSYPYVVAQIHSKDSVGIDLEQPKDKLLKIAHRVLSPSEQLDAGENIVKHCVYWCAKEALYKIYGKRGLHFENQLNLAPFNLEREGSLSGKINVNEDSIQVALQYIVETDYVMVYTKFE